VAYDGHRDGGFHRHRRDHDGAGAGDGGMIRADLSPIERALHVARRKELYEHRHPETKSTKAGGPGRAKRTQSQLGTDTPTPAFIDDTAENTGQGRTTVRSRCTARPKRHLAFRLHQVNNYRPV
jgi:hypothetical protein